MSKFKKFAFIWIGLGILAAPYYIWKDIKAKEQYEAGIQCVAAYSLARDFAEKAGDKAKLKRLTADQNKVFLKFKAGELLRSDIESAKAKLKRLTADQNKVFLKKAGELLRSDIESAKRTIHNKKVLNPDDYCAAF